MKYLISRNAQPEGPFSLETLRHMASLGAVSDDTPVMGEGGAKWLPLGLLLGAQTPAMNSTSETPRYKVRCWSQASVVLFPLGVVGLCFYGLGLFAIVAGFCLPWAHRFHCGACKKEVPLERDTCPYCGKRMGLVQEIQASQLRNINAGEPAGPRKASHLAKFAIIYTIAILVIVFGVAFSVMTPRKATVKMAAPTTLSQTEHDAVCKAWIALLFNQPVSAISIYKRDGDVVYLAYTRASDLTVWKTRCRIEGNRVIWGNDTGRWRIDPRDEVGTFTLNRANRTMRIQGTAEGEQFAEQILPF